MKPFALQAGLAGGLLSLIALAIRGRIETGSAAHTLSAPSHWLWGDQALRQASWSMRYTGVGILIHQLSAWLWGGLHACRDLSPERAMKDAAVTTAAAVATDLILTPRRFTPGFERQLSPASLVWVYGAFAVGLALAVRRRPPSHLPRSIAMTPRSSDQPAGAGDRVPSKPAAPMSPGDEAPAGTPGTGETVCPGCGGTGRKDGAPCPMCTGTGKVTAGIGGA